MATLRSQKSFQLHFTAGQGLCFDCEVVCIWFVDYICIWFVDYFCFWFVDYSTGVFYFVESIFRISLDFLSWRVSLALFIGSVLKPKMIQL